MRVHLILSDLKRKKYIKYMSIYWVPHGKDGYCITVELRMNVDSIYFTLRQQIYTSLDIQYLVIIFTILPHKYFISRSRMRSERYQLQMITTNFLRFNNYEWSSIASEVATVHIIFFFQLIHFKMIVSSKMITYSFTLI